jgi:hypothetical protein
MTIKLMPPGPDEAPLLTRDQVDILITLADCGPANASLFETVEDQLDDLFRMRPRLVALVPGHIDAVVKITEAGRSALHRALS